MQAVLKIDQTRRRLKEVEPGLRSKTSRIVGPVLTGPTSDWTRIMSGRPRSPTITSISVVVVGSKVVVGGGGGGVVGGGGFVAGVGNTPVTKQETKFCDEVKGDMGNPPISQLGPVWMRGSAHSHL